MRARKERQHSGRFTHSNDPTRADRICVISVKKRLLDTRICSGLGTIILERVGTVEARARDSYGHIRRSGVDYGMNGMRLEGEWRTGVVAKGNFA